MMADGGKSEVGILKEKRACNPDVVPASVLGVATLDEKIAEKKVRRMGKKIRQKRIRRRRGGRISGKWSGHTNEYSGSWDERNKTLKSEEQWTVPGIPLYDDADWKLYRSNGWQEAGRRPLIENNEQHR